MARFAFVWEMGLDIGHLARLKPVADELIRRGHSACFVVRKITHAERVLDDIPFVQGPEVAHKLSDKVTAPATYADILHDSCGRDAESLSGLVQAWRNLFSLLDADVAILDYSPFAYLALQGLPVKTVMLGTGFACPPDIYPLPDLRPWENNYPDRLRMNEDALLSLLNAQLQSQGQAPLPHAGALFNNADAVCLATFAELDHYPQRSGGDYWGTWSYSSGSPVQWPQVDGPRIFAYLKPFQELPRLLRRLADLGHPVLAYLSGVEASVIEHFRSETLHIVSQPLDITGVTESCDLAILNAGHGTTSEMLLAGIPILEIPLYAEQYLVAENVERLGAGIRVDADKPEQMISALDQLLSDDNYSKAAAEFAHRHRDHNPQRQLEKLADKIELLL